MIFIQIPLGILNNREEVFNIREIAGELLVNGSHIGTVENKIPFVIPGFGRVVVNLSINLQINNTVLALVSLLNGSGSVVVSLVGKIFTDTITVPLSIVKKFR